MELGFSQRKKGIDIVVNIVDAMKDRELQEGGWEDKKSWKLGTENKWKSQGLK